MPPDCISVLACSLHHLARRFDTVPLTPARRPTPLRRPLSQIRGGSRFCSRNSLCREIIPCWCNTAFAIGNRARGFTGECRIPSDSTVRGHLLFENIEHRD